MQYTISPMGYLQHNFTKVATRLAVAGSRAVNAGRTAAAFKPRVKPPNTTGAAAPVKATAPAAQTRAATAPTPTTAPVATPKATKKLSAWEKLRNILMMRTSNIVQNALAMTHGGVPNTLLASNPTLAFANGGIRSLAALRPYFMRLPYLF